MNWTNFEMLGFLLLAALGGIALYFFVITRLSVIIQSKMKNADPDTAHIYWIYKSPFFIWLSDRMFIVAPILLCQYSKLVKVVVKKLNPSLKDKRILQMSCAFGNISEKIAEHCAEEGAKEFVITDIMQSELDNAKRKLTRYENLCSYDRQDATKMHYDDQSFDYVVMFFLPHEVPFEKKEKVMSEATRVLKPGGKIVVGEFHKPKLKLLQGLGHIYFKIFEPYALEMWGKFNFSEQIDKWSGGPYKVNKQTFFMDNFQVITIKKLSSD